jgi:hypothetical protein
MDRFIKIALTCLPGLLIFLATNCWIPGAMTVWALDWTPANQKFWFETRLKYARPDVAAPAFTMKDVLETPLLPVCTLFLLTSIGVVIYNRHNINRLKTITFWYLLATSLISRSLASFSGSLHYNHDAFAMMFPTNAPSPLKGPYLMWMIEWLIWDCIYTSRYVDGDGTASILPMSEPCKDEKVTKEPHVTWQDAVLRLAYYHIIDNTIHVIYLRYSWTFGEGQPYTSYINNSEILTVVLAVQMAVWTWLRMRTRTREQVVMKKGRMVV